VRCSLWDVAWEVGRILLLIYTQSKKNKIHTSKPYLGACNLNNVQGPGGTFPKMRGDEGALRGLRLERGRRGDEENRWKKGMREDEGALKTDSSGPVRGIMDSDHRIAAGGRNSL
jgi:hypothetical protein